MIPGASVVPMENQPEREAVLIVGAYGTGKTELAAEIAEVLEARGRPYAAIDLDWLAWADTREMDDATANRLFLKNLSAVIANDLDEGVRLFVLAGSYSERSEFDDLVEMLPMPLRVVRLTVPLDVIARRLRADDSAGRHDALAEAEAGIARRELPGIEDRTVSNDRPIQETAAEVLDWLGWL
jgi:Type IV secretion-system coupling protein DNA-binding domain